MMWLEDLLACCPLPATKFHPSFWKNSRFLQLITFVLGPIPSFARSKIVWAMAKLEVKLQKLVSKVETLT